MKKSWTIIVSSIVTPSLWAAPQYNLPKGVTPVSHDIYNLHMIAFWVCVAIGLIVFSVMIYSIIAHRKRPGHKPAKFHGNTKLEIIWAVVPAIILIGLAIPATYVLMRMHDTNDAHLTVKVTGLQWKWRYDYLNHNVGFYSNIATSPDEIANLKAKNPHYLLEVDKPLVLPINTKIRIVTTSNDVIHSWWVPDLGVKKDAVPGFINETWVYINKPGIYRGQCAELCGMNHAFMPIVVVAMQPNEFNQWLAKQKQTKVAQQKTSTQKLDKNELMKLGEKVYLRTCSACHQANGQGLPPAFPSLIKSPMITGDVNAHVDIVLNGKSGTAMQAFREQLSDAEIAAVVTYERNSWDNNTGDVIQPIEVNTLRTGKKNETTTQPAAKPKITLSSQQREKGEMLFQQYCASCHTPDKLSEITSKEPEAQIRITLFGNLTAAMPNFNIWLTDQDVIDILNYININSGKTFSLEQVKKVKVESKEHSDE